MLKVKVYANWERSEPAMICDACKREIADVGLAAVVFNNLHVATDEWRDALVVHKGPCHDAAEMVLGGKMDTGWYELGTVLNRVYSGTAFGGEERDEGPYIRVDVPGK